MKHFLLAAVSFGVASAMDSSHKRAGPCSPLKNSALPAGPIPNTPESFASWAPFHDIPGNVTSPLGFEPIVRNWDSAIRSTKYIDHILLDLYEPERCAEQCNSHKDCDSFNIFFQRNPAVEPARACPNPTAETSVVCSLYDGRVSPNELVDFGQIRGPADSNGEQFEVIIRGSSLYHRVADASSPSATGATTTVTVTVPCSSTGSIFNVMPSTPAPGPILSSRTHLPIDVVTKTVAVPVAGLAKSTLIRLTGAVSRRS